MTAGWWGLLAVLALWGAVVLWRERREAREREGGAGRRANGVAAEGRDGDDGDDGIDHDTLRAAEEEVRGLGTDVKGRPFEDQVGDDWGPGTPKPPYA